MSLRSELADFLRARLPGFKVLAYQYELEHSTMKVVMVHRAKVEPNPARHALLDHSMRVQVLVPLMVGEAAEDAADAALLAVLRALQEAENVEWTEAERSTYQNFIGYEVTVNLTAPNDTLI